jgi:uncharacterized membrane protein
MSWSRRIAIVAAAVACFGLLDSGYLTIKHLQGSFIRCGEECSAVLGSRYAEGVAGIPMAGFGAMAYITVIIATVSAAFGSPLGRRIFTFMALAMALVSVWLIYLQAFVIHSFCKYCLASAAASFTLAGLVVIERLLASKGPRVKA